MMRQADANVCSCNIDETCLCIGMFRRRFAFILRRTSDTKFGQQCVELIHDLRSYTLTVLAADDLRADLVSDLQKDPLRPRFRLDPQKVEHIALLDQYDGRHF